MAANTHLLVVAVALTLAASPVLSFHPRFRFWLPAFHSQLQARRPTTTVHTSQDRPSDRPTVRRVHGTAGRGALSLSCGSASLPSSDITSSHLPVSRKGLERILSIRRMLEKMALSLTLQTAVSQPATN
ncbi:hypothetical protein ACOMHN_056565 [Nucella lapillus]